MIMFGSNNYLGLANHPYVKEKIIEAIHEYGNGIGGPQTLSAAHATLDLIEGNNGLQEALRENISYVSESLNALEWDFEIETQTPIVIIRIPESMDIRKANNLFHESGIFVNAIEFPAVDLNNQRFRVIMMATHTRDDIDRLVEQVDIIWRLWSKGSEI